MATSLLRTATAAKRSFVSPVRSSSRYSKLRDSREASNFLTSFIAENQPPQSTVDHFRSLVWPREILENGNYEPIPFFSRHLNHDTGENRFFGQVVNTNTAIPHFLSLRRSELKTPDPVAKTVVHFPTTDIIQRPGPEPDLLCLISLGRDLEAHPSIVHGGFQGVLFDEVMRFAILLHNDQICQPGPRKAHYTAQMAISYRQSMTVPGDILARSWVTGRSGRKWFATAEIVDSRNNVLTAGSSVWVTAK